MHGVAALLARPRRRRLPHRRDPPHRQGSRSCATTRRATAPEPAAGAASATSTTRITPTSTAAARLRAPARRVRRARGRRRGLSLDARPGRRLTTARATSCISRSTSRSCCSRWDAGAFGARARALRPRRAARRLARPGALEPRRPAPRDALRRPGARRGARARRRADAAHAARHAVPLLRRGDRHAQRRDPAGAPAGPARLDAPREGCRAIPSARRCSGSAEPGAGFTQRRRPGCRSRADWRAQRRGAARRSAARSCGSTATCSRCGARTPALSAATGRELLAHRRTCSPGSGAPRDRARARRAELRRRRSARRGLPRGRGARRPAHARRRGAAEGRERAWLAPCEAAVLVVDA